MMTDRFAGTPSTIRLQWRDLVEDPEAALPLEKLDGVVHTPCDTCTLCCRSNMQVRLKEAEAKRLPHYRDERGLPHLEHRGRDCIMFDAQNNRCSIYDTRPLACRTYDCRAMWLAGLRNTHRGKEVNQRLNEWRTRAYSDVDLGIIALAWHMSREYFKDCKDVGLAAGAALMHVALISEQELAAIGRAATGVEHVLDALNRSHGDREEAPE